MLVPKKKNNQILFIAIISVLSLTSTIGMVFFFLFPLNWFGSVIGLPDTWPSYWNPSSFVEMVTPIAFFSLAIVLLYIIVGFIIKRYKISILGSVALYIPILGYFSFAMSFMFTGVGVLFVLWIPFVNYCPGILKLGDIVLVPLLPLTLLTSTPLYTILLIFFLLIQGLGITIFFFSVAEWFYSRFINHEITVSRIYRYSRHPQYLGFLIWSYGILLSVSPIVYPSDVTPPLPTLLWLINALVVVTVALFEENELLRIQNTDYTKWREETPFMLPLPNFVSALLIKPVKVFLKKEWPKNRKDIAFIISFYTVILIFLSALSSILEISSKLLNTS